jgi:hypothetical protein
MPVARRIGLEIDPGVAIAQFAVGISHYQPRSSDKK